ncbi:putative HicB family RNase H-like nuclease [Parabacteroides sp. PFB2-12]|uniref:type II toxin-antitoxin system HicB family antitoxin n=1 Tax=unclassified Parabacteroides TaxID=2649774 RepID=UPI002475751A|nr:MULTISPECIES: type II toxin-antitoxin system HicB family antitoxin [unclassified Parabacteroides]MDH6342943.1 putative HicB family RNase H-like nuclease [Parabacteroides sp. PM6-13]MDH6391042.1 putative HicB family RNase H-like nuclease [Parabacteroides sp. PFB2-12]
MDNLEYKGYFGSVEYNKTDDCLVGKVLGMSKDSITYEGKDITELKADFEAGIDSYIEGCEELGIKPRKAFSGSLNVRISSEIHSRVAMLAEKAGISINAFIKETLEEKVSTAGF